MIELKNISKDFNGHLALQNINLKLEKKEVAVIIGSSGSGKSSLLRMMNFLDTPTKGDVIVDGQVIKPKNRDKLCRVIGMVFQQFHLFPHMNVLENLTYSPQNILNINPIDAQQKARELLANFNIIDKMHAYPNDLSGGQKQRIAICRALMMDPKLILFDEPTSALDPELIKDVVAIIQELKDKMSMVIVTHHINFAKIIADRIIFMDKGIILADQPATEFFEKPISHRARLFLRNIENLL